MFHDRGSSTAGVLTSNQGAIEFNPWNNIIKGTSVSSRIGDEIYPRGMSCRLYYTTAASRASQFVRVIVAVIPKVVAGVIMDGTNFDLMDAAGSNDTVTGIVKKEGVKVLYDKLIQLKSHTAVGSQLEGDQRFYKRFYIKSKKGKKIRWGQDGNIINNPVGLWVIPYDQYATLRSDTLGWVTHSYKLYFKDV